MMPGIMFKQRDIVLIPFPYSDLSSIKKRPVIIISNSRYHKNNNDVICCAITSSKKEFTRGVKINNSDLDEGNLNFESVVKFGKIFTILQNQIIKKLGKLNIARSKEIIKELNLNIEIEE
jgi:mRNA interferase MazF